MAVGKTKGRGRQDREHQSAQTVKAIYVYPLQADFRARMGVPEPVGIVALQPGQGLDGDAWASQGKRPANHILASSPVVC